MKKIWVLERKFTEEDKELLEELKKEHPEVNRDYKDYYEVLRSNNYYSFCNKVKKEFKRADSFAISELKKKLNPNNEKIAYCVDTNNKYIEIHNKVKDSYKITLYEIEDNEDSFNENTPSKDCESFKLFLWSSK